MIPELREAFNQRFEPAAYERLLLELERRCGAPIGFRVAETPVFMRLAMIEQMAAAGAEMARRLIADESYMSAARQATPAAFRVAGETAHPNFLTADFALVRDGQGELTPRLVEIQAFPSVYGYQAVLCAAYREIFGLAQELGHFLGGLEEREYLSLLAKTVLGGHDPENVVLTEIDPASQKTRADFEVTSRRLGIEVVDIRGLQAVGDRLHYRNRKGKLTPIHRIYNRAIADELIARNVTLPIDFTRPWDVEWAGHPNWYFLISKFSLPYLSSAPLSEPSVPPAVLVSEFLEGRGRETLEAEGVELPKETGPATIYRELLLKPLFSFAGRGIEFEPTRARLEAIPPPQRSDFLLQQRMHFVPTIETPWGMTQAEIRILYLWPDGECLTPVLPLVRLGRGKMMGVDHNRGQQWVGGSAAFFPKAQQMSGLKSERESP